MSHKVATVVTIQVRIPVPVGCNTAQMLAFVREMLSGRPYDGLPTKIDPNMLIVKLVKKETAYT